MTRMRTEVTTAMSERTETEPGDAVLYVLKFTTTGRYRLEIPHTGEIREALEFQPLLRSLCADEGFYLRRKG